MRTRRNDPFHNFDRRFNRMHRFVTFFIGLVFILVFGVIAVQVGLVAWFITNPASAERVMTDTAEGVGRVLSGFANGLEEGRNK